MGTLLTDEVWHQFDPNVGRLSRRTTVRLWLALGGGCVAMVISVAVWFSGLVIPQLGGRQDTLEYGIGVGTFRHSVTVFNSGWTSVRVTGAGRSGPGLALESVEGTLPITLGHNEGVVLLLHYRVTDCRAVPTDSWPVPVRIARPWGTFTVYIDLPTQQAGDILDRPELIAGADRQQVPWQQNLAAQACVYTGG